MRTPFVTQVAGVYYHCQDMESGAYEGYLKPEKNSSDLDAIAIYTADGKHVGYVPRFETDKVRRWTKDMSKVQCQIALSIEKEWGRYSGVVAMVDGEEFPESEAFKDKKIYVSVSEHGKQPDIYRFLVASYGAEITRRLTMDTDFVVCVGEFPLTVTQKQDDPKYHFKVLRLQEFMKEAIPEQDRDAAFWDKEVAMQPCDDAAFQQLVDAVLIEKGARVVPRIRKKSTELLIKLGSQTSQAELDKAFELSVPVIEAKDLIPPINKTPENYPPADAKTVYSDTKRAQDDSKTVRVELTAVQPEAEGKKKATVEDFVLAFVFVLICGFLLVWFILYLFAKLTS